MPKQHWVFISPHFDDVALSCGGVVWELCRQGCCCEIWTIFGGFPPDDDYSEFARQNHAAWGLSGSAAITMRRAEDQHAAAILGATARPFDWPDAIYRRDVRTGQPIVTDNATLFGTSPEDDLISAVSQALKKELPPEAQLVLPIGLGQHIDHLLVSQAGEQLSHPRLYYADYPYILMAFERLNDSSEGWYKQPLPLSKAALTAWQEAVLSYPTQLGGFWRDAAETRLALHNYLAGGGGRLWNRISVPEPVVGSHHT